MKNEVILDNDSDPLHEHSTVKEGDLRILLSKQTANKSLNNLVIVTKVEKNFIEIFFLIDCFENSFVGNKKNILKLLPEHFPDSFLIQRCLSWKL